jgi:hypothetical protein
MSTSRISTMVVLAILAVGCAGSSGHAAAGGSGGASAGGSGNAGAAGHSSGGDAGAFDTFYAQVVQRGCDAIFACPLGNDDLVGHRAIFESPEACAAYFLAVARRTPEYAARRQAVENGRLLIDEAKAASCLTSPVSCQELYAGNWPCANALRGAVALGAACAAHWECAGDAYCGSQTASCPGSCQPRKAPGEACNDDVECQAGDGIALCDYGVSVPSCVVEEIGPAGQLGDACGSQPDGTRVFCADGLWCDGSHICRAEIPSGDACSDIDDACSVGSVCLTDLGVCTPVTVTRQAGGPCDTDSFWGAVVCDPVAGLHCVNQQCEPIGDGSDGSPCITNDYGDLTCAPGLHCDDSATPAVCHPLEQPGDACNGTGQCATSCDSATLTCADLYCGL